MKKLKNMKRLDNKIIDKRTKKSIKRATVDTVSIRALFMLFNFFIF